MQRQEDCQSHCSNPVQASSSKHDVTSYSPSSWEAETWELRHFISSRATQWILGQSGLCNSETRFLPHPALPRHLIILSWNLKVYLLRTTDPGPFFACLLVSRSIWKAGCLDSLHCAWSLSCLPPLLHSAEFTLQESWPKLQCTAAAMFSQIWCLYPKLTLAWSPF